jgi:hypothetical protein
MESIKKQTYKKIVTIVHSDDPRDEYVNGDIIIKGPAYGPEYGSGSYNLYNNRLLKEIPDGPGWYHFIDDDDVYASDDIIEKIVEKSKSDYVNVARVKRWNNIVFPKDWGIQKSYQTECFFLHTDHKLKATWWGNKGGDHHYSKQLTKILPINWIDNLLLCCAQEGKGHGNKLDKGGRVTKQCKFKAEDKVPVLGLRKSVAGNRSDWIRAGEIKYMRYETAEKLERLGKIKFTNYAQNYIPERPPVRSILQIN